MATMLDFALAYVDFFHAVVPVGAWTFTGSDGKEVDMWKKPLMKDWSDKPLTTRAAVKAFWSSWGYHGKIPGIGIATGQICGGYVVIDLDRKPDRGIDGYEILLDWQRDNGVELPDTWTAITGSGGYHFWYRTDKAMRPYSNGDLGVDLRSDGAQVVMPPSLHPSGKRYQWEISPSERDCAEANEAVMAFIDHCRPSGSQYSVSTRRGMGGNRKMLLPPELPEGNRHKPLISLIGTMNRLGVSDEAIEAAVRLENDLKCIPPLSETELQREIFPAIYRWDKGVSEEKWMDRNKWLAQNLVKMRAERLQSRTQQS